MRCFSHLLVVFVAQPGLSETAPTGRQQGSCREVTPSVARTLVPDNQKILEWGAKNKEVRTLRDSLRVSVSYPFLTHQRFP